MARKCDRRVDFVTTFSLAETQPHVHLDRALRRAELQSMVMRITGWAEGLGIEFICIDGMERVPPLPYLYKSLVAAGHYSVDETYRGWELKENLAKAFSADQSLLDFLVRTQQKLEKVDIS